MSATRRGRPKAGRPTSTSPRSCERIPHRYPFLLVDRAEDYRPHKSIVGIKCVTMNEPFFQGHFPDNPVMPGVLIIEAMAQTGAVLMSKSLDVDVDGQDHLLHVARQRAASARRCGRATCCACR